VEAVSDDDERAFKHLAEAITGLTHELCALRNGAAAGMVSRTDLAEAEARLSARIGEAWTMEDQYAIDNLLELARRKTLRLEKLRAALQKLDARNTTTA
jgi:hypothetical protein